RRPATPPGLPAKNRNKRSIVLDLKQAEHFAALEKLLQTADIFIYSVRPKAMARMGLTPERFAELNPGMISVSLVGYGEGGPYTGRPAYEDLIQGLTAIPSLLTRTGSAQPQYVPVSFNDRAVGVYAAAMMMIALNHRNRTGVGRHIEASAPGQGHCSAPRRQNPRACPGRAPPLGAGSLTGALRWPACGLGEPSARSSSASRSARLKRQVD